MARWVKVAERGDVQEGALTAVTIDGRALVLGCARGTLYAFDAACPHASANLAEGDLRPHYVICPLHAYRFDLATGRCLKPPDGPRLRVYPVEVREGAVWVRV